MSKKIPFDPSLSNRYEYFKAWIDSLFIDHAIFRLVWSNFHAVIPKKIYRCNHPTPARLTRLKTKYRLKTIINLRGHRDCGSDALSRTQAKSLGLIYIDMPFESRGAPHKDRILKLADIYPTLEFPILIHCKSGADRAGLVAALLVLLENGKIEQAMQQLSWRYGHFKHSKTGILDAFLVHYYQETYNKVSFLDWVRNDYDENVLRQSFKSKALSSFITDTILHRE
ncbi:tyrosine-protein phosphatase [Commensalibacter oyaizuii]|uniref:Tyrosine-protein phosphatase n=1 Tax=Commensalibacter oyaizuii TaxID=3043873 RepID=A0ABT6Q260_9PROT|nr:tyrosine-protein phosphatase [Commensalibacter sp. TBRC 16381]MDI2091068.1 tyrosine-protein phosphatase [Commensalibacter sp. TBRC 16381]